MAPRKRSPRAPEAVPDMPNVAESAPARGRSLVFISHDSRDADLAELFADLLSDVSGGTLKSFRSSDNKGTSGIPFGAEWYSAIMSQLDSATDVVALVTQHSVDRPWILYEAGVAKGKLDTIVIGVALGVPLERVSIGPFGQFQNLNDDEDSLTRLALQLLERNPDASPREAAVRMHVKLFREKVAVALAGRDTQSEESSSEDENVAALFEEVKAMVREIPDRIESRTRPFDGHTPLRRMARRSPEFLEEFMIPGRLISPDGGYSTGWMVLISLLRDDLPWLYETGLDIYKTARSGKDIKKLAREFMELLEFTLHSPMGDLLIRDEKMSFRFYRQLPRLCAMYFDQMTDEQSRKKIAG